MIRTLAVLCVAGLTAGGVYAYRIALPQVSADLHGEAVAQPRDWAGSVRCRSCHEDHYRTWHRTFHRTMTQEATPRTVLGRFDGQDLTYWGRTARPVRIGERFFFEYLDPATGQPLVTLPVLRTVGSRRYQQYLTQTPDGGETYYRLHLLWHMEDERWVHVNGIFLGPDEQNYDAHVAVWNHNCIFCHNTGPEPNIVNYEELGARASRGEAIDSALEAKYDSEVAELGIACEACHGPGGEHARRNRNPVRRYVLALGGRDDPTIVNPSKLPPGRAVDLCGQCHAQRTPPDKAALQTWIREGPSFRAGARLADHAQVVHIDTQVPGGVDPDLFRLRFWNDGTARLSAYEYQGLTESACFIEGGLTCIGCHSAHDGDPRGMLTQEHKGNAPCLGCHAAIAQDVGGHTRHAPDSPGSLCYECHMPRIVYGVMEIHRSHRIEVPDPALHTAAARPNACTNCHLDRSPEWAAQSVAAWWGDAPAAAVHRGDGADPDVADAIASLHAGDPVQRVVAARMAGRDGSPLAARAQAFAVPHLLLALQDDYPQVRKQARQSLADITARLAAAGVESGLADLLRTYDFIGPAAERSAAVTQMHRQWAQIDKNGWPEPPGATLLGPDYQPDMPRTEALLRLGRAHAKRIDIGE